MVAATFMLLFSYVTYIANLHFREQGQTVSQKLKMGFNSRMLLKPMYSNTYPNLAKKYRFG